MILERSYERLPTRPSTSAGAQDLTGRVVGQLLVLGLYEVQEGDSFRRRGNWVVRCACGAYETRKARILALGKASACRVCELADPAHQAKVAEKVIESKAIGRLRKEAIRIQQNLCCWCSRKMTSPDEPTLPTAATAEHIVPLSEGGLSVRGNIAAACKECNHGRNARFMQWRVEAGYGHVQRVRNILDDHVAELTRTFEQRWEAAHQWHAVNRELDEARAA